MAAKKGTTRAGAARRTAPAAGNGTTPAPAGAGPEMRTTALRAPAEVLDGLRIRLDGRLSLGEELVYLLTRVGAVEALGRGLVAAGGDLCAHPDLVAEVQAELLDAVRMTDLAQRAAWVDTWRSPSRKRRFGTA